MSIRVAVFDPCRLFREGLATLLKGDELVIVISAPSFAQAAKDNPEGPQVAIWSLDLRTDKSGIVAELQRARADFPGLRAVVLTRVLDAMLLTWAAASGISAVLSRDISAEILRRSLEMVMVGQELFLVAAVANADGPVVASTPSVLSAVQPAQPFDRRRSPRLDSEMGLSEREDQIVCRLATGSPNKLIARDLGITEGTVKVHIKSLLRKLGAANRTQAAMWTVDRALARRHVAAPLGNGAERG